jgi:phosphatidylglycerophosphate synthase
LLIDAGAWLALLGAALLAALLALLQLGFGGRTLAVGLAFYAAIALLVLKGLERHSPHRRFGPANVLTLIRAAFVALLLGVIAADTALGTPGRWWVTAAGTAALLLDGVDGWAARRSGLSSAFGARFDMEVDALFVLALAALVGQAGQAGAWVLASGLLRYLFVAASWLVPALAAPLAPSLRRKTICVVQIAVLLLALAPPVAPWAGQLLCLGGLLLLSYSFLVDGVILLGPERDGRRAQGMPT